MAIYPKEFETRFKLQPGARGEQFVADMPGYRDGAVRINRSNNRLNTTPHEALSQKYLFDTRLRPLFKYGYAVGYNHMVITKGHIVAVDPYMDKADWTADKQYNVLTLANGGATVKIREAADTYPSNSIISTDRQGKPALLQGLGWAPVEGLGTVWNTGYYRSCQNSRTAQLSTASLTVDTAGIGNNRATGKLVKDGVASDDYRAANIPVGMLQRNEYTRFDNDSMDGMQPGPIATDCIVELPYFAFKDKAEQNPWGSIYGNLKVGDLVKADENGKLVVSPLSADAVLETMSAVEIERERQQVVGRVISFNHDMVPEGGYKWATWALEDRLRFEGFNPEMYPATNRPGEDSVAASAYQSTGRYPGYPYDQAYTEHDLQMLGSGTGRAGNFNKFMNPVYQYDNLGIPALTDGGNAVVKSYENRNAALIRYREDKTVPYVRHFIRIAPNGNIVDGSLEVQIVATGTTSNTFVPVSYADNVNKTPKAIDSIFSVTYYDAVQGLIVIDVMDPDAADAALTDNTKSFTVNLKYKKAGEAGVPTFMDWDGCVGSAKILLEL